MAYTASDVATIQAAILALASGTRVVRITYEGETVEYGQADLEALKALRAQAKAEAASAAGKKKYAVITTRKGL